MICKNHFEHQNRMKIDNTDKKERIYIDDLLIDSLWSDINFHTILMFEVIFANHLSQKSWYAGTILILSML